MPALPRGVSEQGFQAALRRIRAVVGDPWVFTSDEDVALYRDAYSPLWGEEGDLAASAAVAPTTVEEVSAILRIAGEYRLPIYPISTGKNLTYGGSAPVYPGSVVLDLKRMNRILDVNERDRSCLVEPGVSYFDLYRHFRQHKLRLWIDCPDPGWGSPVGNALDRGVGQTGVDVRDHFDAHCGMEVVLGSGEVIRTGMGASPQAKTWQLYKYGMGPWIDGIFSQSNYGVVTKMGFWLMEEPEAALSASVSVPARGDIVPLFDVLSSLLASHIVSSTANVRSPIMNGSADPELVRLRLAGAGASDQDWARYAATRNQPFWVTSFTFYGPAKLVAASWEHTKERFSTIRGVQFSETASYTFPLSDEQVERVTEKSRLGIPSLALFGSRNSATDRPSEGHLDFSPMIAPRGEELLALTNLTARIYGDLGLTPPNVGGVLFHPRSMIVFHAVPTYRNAADNRRSRALFERLVTETNEKGWNIYRIHAHFMALGMKGYGFGNGALHRLHETLKDAVDPGGVLAAGRYDIWPKHLRESRS